MAANIRYVSNACSSRKPGGKLFRNHDSTSRSASSYIKKACRLSLGPAEVDGKSASLSAPVSKSRNTGNTFCICGQHAHAATTLFFNSSGKMTRNLAGTPGNNCASPAPINRSSAKRKSALICCKVACCATDGGKLSADKRLSSTK